MENDGYKLAGTLAIPNSNDLILDANGDIILAYMEDSLRETLGNQFLHMTSSESIKKSLTESIKKSLTNLSIGNHKISVVSVDSIPTDRMIAVNMSVVLHTPINYTTVFTHHIPEKIYDWHNFFMLCSDELQIKIEELSLSKYTKARILISKALHPNFEQTKASWLKTIDIFTLSSKEKIVEFLIDPSETIREVAKARIRQLEDNKK